MTKIWSDILAIPREEIGIDRDFFQIGGHSLKATILVSRVHKEFNIKLPLTEIFRQSTIRTLADIIKKGGKEKFNAIKPTEKKEYYNQSPTQKRLYILQQMALESTAYNMPQVLHLTGTINREKQETTFRALIQRHESLRTSFHMIAPVTPGGVIPVQIIHPTVTFNIETLLLEGKEQSTRHHDVNHDVNHDVSDNHRLAQIQRAFFRPFDLARAPLLRVGIVEITGTETKRDTDTNTGTVNTTRELTEAIMLIDMHHIITDGTSQEVLIKEFHHLYTGDENVPPLKLQYKDYAEWQNNNKHKQLMKKQEEFWMKMFSGELPVLHLPIDYKRPVIQNFEGDSISFVPDIPVIQKIKNNAKKNEATFYMAILAILNILLAKLSGGEDIIIGSPIAARRHADLENIIGMFANTLAIRNFPREKMTYTEFLEEVRKRTMDVYENQDYPFDDLVDKLLTGRDISRNPLFDVSFNLLNQANKTGYVPGNTSSIEKENARFDLALYALETGENTIFRFQYCTKLFDKQTVEGFIEYFKRILSAVAADPGVKISEIDVIPAREKQQLEFKRTNSILPRGVPGGKTDYVAPGNELEENLTRLWAAVLEKEKESIGIDDNFFQLGGQSLKATILIAKIHKELNVKIPLAELFKAPDIRSLAAHIEEAEKVAYESENPTAQQNSGPVVFMFPGLG
ncbi:MAG: hypothetical protein GY757_06945, partial [bacterium]|nr:hypothetical protein [bacterium]